MKRWHYFSVAALLFMLAGCSENITNEPTEPVNEQGESPTVDEGDEELDGQDPVEDGEEQTV